MTTPAYDFARVCAEAIVRAKVDATTRGEIMRKSDIERIIREQDALRLDKPKAGKAKPKAKQTDEEWLAEMEADPAMAGVNVRAALAEAQFWCRNNRRECTRRFFANWLLNPKNRVIRAPGGSEARKSNGNGSGEPAGWRDALKARYPSIDADILATKAWEDISPDLRADALKELQKMVSA